jgi:hypothetical protein
MAEKPLTRLRRLCAELPESTEKEAWGAPTFRAGAKGKLYAMFSDHHHGHAHVAVWCHAPVGKQEVLVAAEPERFFKPAYVGPSGWIGIVLKRIGDDELRLHLREAYLRVATKTLAKRLEADER